MSDATMGELVAETTTMKGDGRQTCRIPSRFAAARTCGATAQRIAAFVTLRQSGRIFIGLFAGKDRKCGHAILFPAASAWPP